MVVFGVYLDNCSIYEVLDLAEYEFFGHFLFKLSIRKYVK